MGCVSNKHMNLNIYSYVSLGCISCLSTCKITPKSFQFHKYDAVNVRERRALKGYKKHSKQSYSIYLCVICNDINRPISPSFYIHLRTKLHIISAITFPSDLD